MAKQGYSQLLVTIKSASDLIKSINKINDELEERNPGLSETVVNIAGTELHATLIYDPRNPDLDPGRDQSLHKARIIGVERLGNPSGRHYALVLLLESESIQKRFKELLAKGYEHSYPDLKIHVSIHYGDMTDIAFPVLEQAFKDGKLPETMTLGAETWDVLD